MVRKFQLSDESFEALLNWLDEDRDSAGQKYEQIRRSLLKIFRGRGCPHPEDLADETFNRVTAKITVLSAEFDGEPVAYFLSVARLIYLEDIRRRAKTTILSDKLSYEHQFVDNSDAPRNACLQKCFAALDADDRETISNYYTGENSQQKQMRSEYARRLGVSSTVLRVRAYRLRLRLYDCVQNCLQKK